MLVTLGFAANDNFHSCSLSDLKGHSGLSPACTQGDIRICYPVLPSAAYSRAASLGASFYRLAEKTPPPWRPVRERDLIFDAGAALVIVDHN
jgi:hypothetical protein